MAKREWRPVHKVIMVILDSPYDPKHLVAYAALYAAGAKCPVKDIPMLKARLMAADRRVDEDKRPVGLDRVMKQALANLDQQLAESKKG